MKIDLLTKKTDLKKILILHLPLIVTVKAQWPMLSCSSVAVYAKSCKPGPNRTGGETDGVVMPSALESAFNTRIHVLHVCYFYCGGMRVYSVRVVIIQII